MDGIRNMRTLKFMTMDLKFLLRQRQNTEAQELPHLLCTNLLLSNLSTCWNNKIASRLPRTKNLNQQQRNFHAVTNESSTSITKNIIITAMQLTKMRAAPRSTKSPSKQVSSLFMFYFRLLEDLAAQHVYNVPYRAV